MAVDVQTQIEIARPRAEVAAFASDPDSATAWYENIKAVVWQSQRPLAVGTRLEFVAQFLGRRLAYTYEVAELVPGERLVLRTAQGPFPMETTYTWEDAGDGVTRMIVRNRGEPAGFAKLSAPMVAAAMRRANRKDLERLKAILERGVWSASASEEGAVVYVRVVRFTDVSAERIAGLLARIKESDGPPPGVPTTGLKILHDEAQGTALVLQYFATAEDMDAGAQAFSAMDAAETPGVRASADMCEVKLELEVP